MKKLAVICNYQLNSSRIGGMDRFFVAYDQACKEKGIQVKWFFSGGTKFNFYQNLEITICEKTSIENCFFDYLQKNESHFDIVVTHFLELCTPFFKKIKRFGVNYIIAVDHNPRPINGFPLRKRLKNIIKGKLYSKYIDKFIGVSEYTKKQILKDYGTNLESKTQVVYNGIATEDYIVRRNSNYGKFIVASHLRYSKGIQDLIKAVAVSQHINKHKIRIDIFGEGPMEAELRDLVQSEKLEKQIRFFGSSPNLPEIFQNYSYLLQPTYMECFSLSILESLAANVPVISTPVGGNLEIIEDGINGFIFQPGDIELLSEIIGDILDHKKTINKPVNQLIENKFYLDKMVLDHLNLLDG